MQKHALILGTIPSQAEAMEWLQSQGWKVSACGHIKEGPGVELADYFYQVDTLDVARVTELAKDIGADLIYSVGSDIAMPTVAQASKALNLPCFFTPDTARLLQNKTLTRKFLNEHGISVTRYQRLRSEEDLQGFDVFPAILKPANSQGQRGISIVHTIEEAARSLPQSIAASKTGEAIIEELLDGPEFSVHVFVVDSEVRCCLPSDRMVWDGPAVGIPIGHTIPAHSVPQAVLPEVENIIAACVRALEVTDGPLYFQMKMTRDKGPKIIEIAPRLDGCHMWRQIEHYCGVNLIAACFERLMGLPWQDPKPTDPSRTCSLRFFLQKTGEAFDRKLHPIPEGANCVHQQFFYSDGDKIRTTNGVIEKVGYYILEEKQ